MRVSRFCIKDRKIPLPSALQAGQCYSTISRLNKTRSHYGKLSAIAKILAISKLTI
ncbi:MAG TPA: hypothetical protein VK211_13690 [Kamptonema sp.]|nr:hypothetical protein [Kamptonema sp.]